MHNACNSFMEYNICDIHIKVKIKGMFFVGLIETFEVIKIGMHFNLLQMF